MHMCLKHVQTPITIIININIISVIIIIIW